MSWPAGRKRLTPQSPQSQYKAQFASHLADNREEQATRCACLEQLTADEAWLVKALEAVSASGEAGIGAQAPVAVSAPGKAGIDAQVPAGEPVQPQDEPAAVAVKKTTARKTVATR
ncbi:hypothetical protein NFX46_18340 [Streptomyces phaeoluteigriseus]|uniref:Transposase n=1 Tax=Streptomyces phaeoluteigriseus TaxID=114686 RepID=A0ABY4Z922_9ACTN|nr:hypothetical protein [Streptomyces phaeoluteigriseus]USQ85559.1 hypothetical protein NFX46_18340 [Streptomyces phaeoluteigriseus]